MNLKKILDSLSRVQDLSEEEQTPKLKKELYDMILPFVRKYQPIYYPQYKGDLQDLASDFFVQFMTRKGRGEKKENLLDKFDPSVTVLPYLVKVSVQRMLIDRSRSDKGEVNYSENFDDEEDARKLTLNLISQNLTTEDETAIENVEFSDEFIGEMKDKFNELSKPEKDRFRKALMHYRKKVGLHSNFDELFKYLEADMEDEKESFKGSVKIIGNRPDFTIQYTHPDGTVEETPAKSRNLESVEKKAKAQYPGAQIIKSDSVIPLRFLLSNALKVRDENTMDRWHDISQLEEIVAEMLLPDEGIFFIPEEEEYQSEMLGTFNISAETTSYPKKRIRISTEGKYDFVAEVDTESDASVEDALSAVRDWVEF